MARLRASNQEFTVITLICNRLNTVHERLAEEFCNQRGSWLIIPRPSLCSHIDFELYDLFIHPLVYLFTQWNA